MQHFICSIGHGTFLANEEVPRKLSPPIWNRESDINDAISFAGTTAALTITTRPIIEIDPAEPIGPEALDLLPGADVLIACPEGLAHAPGRWIWLVRPAESQLRLRGVEFRIAAPALGKEISRIFDPVPPSNYLKSLERGEENLELWLRPNWSATALLPDLIREIERPADPFTRPAVLLDDDALGELITKKHR